jgi:hypothetical protein
VPKHESFATPQDAVLTFQSKLARDDVAGELDCFSQDFREQNGVSTQVYATVRDRFLAPLGWFGRLVLRYDSLEDNLVGGDASELHTRLVYSLAGHAFEILASREAAFRFPDPESGEARTAPLTRKTACLFNAGSAGDAMLCVEIHEPDAKAELLVRRGLEWAELENGWKLAWVAPVEGTPSVKPLPTPVAGETKTVRVAALRVAEHGRLLGTVVLRVEIPLGEAYGCVRTLPDGTLRIGSPAAAGAPATSIERLHWTSAAADIR